MIFLEEEFSVAEYRSASLAAKRAADCGRQDGGKFGKGNDCASDGSGSSSAAVKDSPAPSKQIDDSWKNEDSEVIWDKSDLQSSSPVPGGEKLSRVSITSPKKVASNIESHENLKELDDVVILSGGSIRGSDVDIQPYGSGLSVVTIFPADRGGDKKEGSVSAEVLITGDEISFEGFFPSAESINTPEKRSRVVSLMMEQVLTSMERAESLGFTRISMEASGEADHPLKGYRIWPHFGFDGPIDEDVRRKLPRSMFSKMGKDRRDVITVRDILGVEGGKEWWEKNGSDTSMTIDFSDKESVGYKKFQEQKAKLARLRARNESRSADCGRDEGGRFGGGNKCAADDGSGGGGAGREPATQTHFSSHEKALHSAVVRWKGSPSDLGIHVQDEIDGKPAPQSASGRKLREMAASLLREVKDKGEPAPTLYRGDDKPPDKNTSPLLGWTSNRRVAEQWARDYGGDVYTLEGVTGLNLKKVVSDVFDVGEDEWIVINDRKTQLLVESRSADCGQDDSGRFVSGNDCAGDDGGGLPPGAKSRTPVADKKKKASGGGGEKKPIDGSWKKQEGSVAYDGKDLAKSTPIKSLSNAAAVVIADGAGFNESLKMVGVTADQAVKLLTTPEPGAVVVLSPGDADNIGSYRLTLDGRIQPPTPFDPSPQFSVSADTSFYINDDVQIRATTSLTRADDDALVLTYDVLGFATGTPEQHEAARTTMTRKLIRGLFTSVREAQRVGVDEIGMIASRKDGVFEGHALWPKFGFDGVIPRRHITPTWSLGRGFFSKYGSKIPKEILSPRAKKELEEGKLTIQALYETREGQEWWEKNGGSMKMSLDPKNPTERFKKMRDRLEGRSAEIPDAEWAAMLDDSYVERRFDDCGKDNLGRFTSGNDCAEEGGGGISKDVSAGAKFKKDETKSKAKKGGGGDGDKIPLGNVRRQEVLLRGGKSVVVIDNEAKERVIEDLRKNPKPAGSHPASSADLYDRTFVHRGDPKRPSKITQHDPIFADSDLVQNGMFVGHGPVARALSARGEESRKEVGGEGPGAVIDSREVFTPEQIDYVASAIFEDTSRAYEEGRNPGFYSTDIRECMEIMSGFYPELSDPDEAARRGTTPQDASFVFTMITAITSNGTDPALNLESADRLYRLYRDHGSLRTPDQLMGGERANEITKSLNRFQDMIDEFGESRVRRLMSGVTTRSRIDETMRRLAKKSEELGGSWSGKQIGDDELASEVVPVSAVFGPKIGSFFANLSGDHRFLTMDRWLMRSFGRVTGELLTRATPEKANKQANEAIKAIRARSRSRDILFGVDKPPLSLTREDVIRSLELQARTGVIEESSAAYEWAKAAQRAYSKVPKSVSASGKASGSYGDHPDPQIRAAHKVGNTMFKSLIHEQQDPRSGTARRNIRNVFREIARRIEAANPDARGGVQVSEIQAVLWQYEQNLWKRLGAKTKIEGDSLYSAAAKKLKERRDSGEDIPSLRPAKPNRPKSVRSYDPKDSDEATGEDEVDHLNQSSQDLWDMEVEQSEVNLLDLLRDIEGDIRESGEEEKESRSDDCVRQDGGRFGVGNNCASEGGGTSTDDYPELDSFKVPPDTKPQTSNKVSLEGEALKSSPPFSGAEKLRRVDIMDPKGIDSRLGKMGVDMGEAVKVVGAGDEGNELLIHPHGSPGAVVVRSSREFLGIPSGINHTSILMDYGPPGKPELWLKHDVIDVLPQIRDKQPGETDEQVASRRHASAREFLRVMATSVEESRKAGVKLITLSAAGRGRGGKNHYRGYTIWPRLGFDAPIPFDLKQKLPPSLSHAKTLLDLHTSKEGTRWWEENGRDIDVTLDLHDVNSPQNQLFDKYTKRLLKESRSYSGWSADDWMSPHDRLVLEEMWDEVWDSDLLDDYSGDDFKLPEFKSQKHEADARSEFYSRITELRSFYAERRADDCGRTPDGKFGPKNDCAGDDGSATPVKAPTRSPTSTPASSKRVDRIAAKLTRDQAIDGLDAKGEPISKDLKSAAKDFSGDSRWRAVGAARNNFADGSHESWPSIARGMVADAGYTDLDVDRIEEIYSSYLVGLDQRIDQYVATMNAPPGTEAKEAARAKKFELDFARRNMAALTAMIAVAAEEFPEIKSQRIRIKDASQMVDVVMRSSHPLDIIMNGGAEAMARNIPGYHDVLTNEIGISTVAAAGMMQVASEDAGKDRYAAKQFSTSQISHVLVHELGHKLHAEALLDHLGIPRPTPDSPLSADQARTYTQELQRRIADADQYLAEQIAGGFESPSKFLIERLSAYGAANPQETVAEYFVGVRLGTIKRDRVLDGYVERLGFPLASLDNPKAAKEKKS